MPSSHHKGILGADGMGRMRHTESMMLRPLTLKEAADCLRVSRDMLNNLLNKRLLRSFHVGRRRFVTMDAIKDFVKLQEENE